MGLAINENDCSMKDNDGCEVGGTGRKGFGYSSCIVHPQHGDENEQVGGEDDHTGYDLIEHGHN